MRCTTARGQFRCDREAGHGGDCETDAGPRARVRVAPADLDARRELVKAAKRICDLEGALVKIRRAPEGADVRAIAAAALENVG